MCSLITTEPEYEVCVAQSQQNLSMRYVWLRFHWIPQSMTSGAKPSITVDSEWLSTRMMFPARVRVSGHLQNLNLEYEDTCDLRFGGVLQISGHLRTLIQVCAGHLHN